jgi:hypothetical protein
MLRKFGLVLVMGLALLTPRISVAQEFPAACTLVGTVFTCPSIEFPTVQLSGLASDSDGVARIDWTVSTDGGGTATGTTTWSIDSLPLTMGANAVTLTLYDILNNFVVYTGTITRRNPIVTASTGVGGSISPLGDVSVTYGGDQLFGIVPTTGYHITSVLVNGLNMGTPSSYLFSTVTSDQTLSATFAIDTFTLTASANAGGSIAPSGVTAANYGGNQHYTITPDVGYALLYLLVDGGSVGFPLTYDFTNVTANHTIEAVFALNQVTPTEQVTAEGIGLKGSRMH